MLVYKTMDQNIQILNKTVVIAITLHVYVLIPGDERRLSLHTNQLLSINSYNNTKGWQLNQALPTHTSKQSKNTRNIFTTALK